MSSRACGADKSVQRGGGPTKQSDLSKHERKYDYIQIPQTNRTRTFRVWANEWKTKERLKTNSKKHFKTGRTEIANLYHFPFLSQPTPTQKARVNPFAEGYLLHIFTVEKVTQFNAFLLGTGYWPSVGLGSEHVPLGCGSVYSIVSGDSWPPPTDLLPCEKRKSKRG